jgi:hypothetical protein
MNDLVKWREPRQDRLAVLTPIVINRLAKPGVQPR